MVHDARQLLPQVIWERRRDFLRGDQFKELPWFIRQRIDHFAHGQEEWDHTEVLEAMYGPGPPWHFS